MSNVINMTEQDFEREVSNSQVPVVVDYWAQWCGPCRALEPVIEDIAAEYGDRIKVVKVNIDEAPGLASAAGVLSIPHVVLYRDGAAVAHSGGARPKAAVVAALGLDTLAVGD